MSDLDRDALQGLGILGAYGLISWALWHVMPWWLALIVAWPALVFAVILLDKLIRR